MFKIVGKTIHITRGDVGTIEVTIPLRDKEGYLKYKDVNNNIYWYDEKNKKLYDNDYEESNLKLSTLTIQLYEFQENDVVRLNVFKYKDCGCIVLSKEVEAESGTNSVDISLTSEETTIEELINKPKKYWYEIVLNPDTNEQTIIGYDTDGEKQFWLYPEAKEER